MIRIKDTLPLYPYSKFNQNGLVGHLDKEEPQKAEKSGFSHQIILWAELWSRDLRTEKT